MAILTAIIGVWDAIIEWFTTALPSVLTIFYSSEGLTFLGVLSSCGLAINVVFLLVSVISNFIHFRS